MHACFYIRSIQVIKHTNAVTGTDRLVVAGLQRLQWIACASRFGPVEVRNDKTTGLGV